ncbi:FtsX-like permease family protein [Trueperella sp.]|uniref:FtsX-like permease family protein n=1 Tax=Trueperella sp. TaxID=2699835 RepID=UPI003736DD14
MSTLTMASNLAIARIRNARGNALLDVFAIIAFAVSSWLLLTTLGGVWMFYNRQDSLSDLLLEHKGLDPFFTDGLGTMYFFLAIVALGLLIIPLLGLGSAATRLGANGRARRLASLRLIGVSAAQVNLMTLVETLLQALVGFAIGLTIYLVTLPAWSTVKFTDIHLGGTEMLLPWWGFLGAFVLVVVITLASTVIGLRRVSISPLGVSRRETPAALKHWRIIGLVVMIPVASYLMRNTNLESQIEQIIGIALAWVGLFLAVSLAGPLFIQVASRPFARTGNPARLLGARRVIDEPRAAWRNISAISLMALIASIVVFALNMSMVGDPDAQALTEIMQADIVKGVVIALGIALALGATSTLIQQAADVFDREDESRALVKMGFPPSTLLKARLWQVMPPLALMLTVTIGVGAMIGGASETTPRAENMFLLVAMIIAGVVLTFVSVLATAPIQSALLKENTRKND